MLLCLPCVSLLRGSRIVTLCCIRRGDVLDVRRCGYYLAAGRSLIGLCVQAITQRRNWLYMSKVNVWPNVIYYAFFPQPLPIASSCLRQVSLWPLLLSTRDCNLNVTTVASCYHFRSRARVSFCTSLRVVCLIFIDECNSTNEA